MHELYTITLSKIARGFETDMNNVVFLVESKLIDFAELQKHFQPVLPRAGQAGIIPDAFQQYLQDLLRRLAK